MRRPPSAASVLEKTAKKCVLRLPTCWAMVCRTSFGDFALVAAGFSSSVMLPCRCRTHCSTWSSASGSCCRSSTHCSEIRGAASAPRPATDPKNAATSSNVPTLRGTPRFWSQVTPAESVRPNSAPRNARKKTDRATQRSCSVSHTPATISAARRMSGVRQAAAREVGMG